MLSQKKHKPQRKKTFCELEPLFQGVRVALMHDLADEYTRKHYCMKEHGAGIPPLNDGVTPYMFKKVQQLLNFDKRVIWSTDRSFETLQQEAFQAFADSQRTFSCPEPMSRRAELVIQEASQIIAEILGEFDYDEWFDSCSFGKRAAVGLPRAECYLDTRFSRVSGTDMQKAAFKHMLSRDIHLLRAVRKKTRHIKLVRTIKATAVPKSWKAARIIAPDTVLGGLLSRGLGLMVRVRLERKTHINLAKQQARHRRWARRASKNGQKATIDMKKASDSFVWRHIELLTPSSWHHALQCVRTNLCDVPGIGVISPKSYMLMGSGHTFPLQTLLFYGLAEAVRSLLNCKGNVSVYGDDIIVPTRMAHHLIVILNELGFSINSEKSFYDAVDPDRPSQTFFRESCGGDFKGGVDVRPYMPECDLQENGKVPRNEFLAWCHKMINGLLDHWESCEIPITLGYLLHQITSKGSQVCFVPPWEVDHAGIRHELPDSLTFGYDCRRVFTAHDSTLSYSRLVWIQPKRKRKVDERPYVWYSYWLDRLEKPVQASPIFKLLAQQEFVDGMKRSFVDLVSLNGEPNRRQKGTFRWKMKGVLC